MDKKVCSAAFYIYCKTTKQRCKGAAAEHSTNADNYRAEILGGILIQVVLIAASQKRPSPYRLAVVECDNNGVVTHGNSPGQGLKERQAQEDALRIFKQLITDHPFEVSYKWVKAHQDDMKN